MRNELSTALWVASSALILTLGACDREGDEAGQAHVPEPAQTAEDTGPVRIDVGVGFVSQVSDGEVAPSRAASELGAICTGNVAEEPSHIVEIESAGRYRVLVESDKDLTIAVVGPGGPFCNDDWQSLNPAVERQWEPGVWEIYVGVVDVELTRASFELIVQKVETAELTRPQWEASPTEGIRRLSAGFSPAEYELTAGGTERAEFYRLAPACVGYISPAAPDLSLESPGIAEPVRLSLESEIDTTLVVRAPDGVWHCSDDADGNAPALRLDEFIGGSWSVWAGTWEAEAAPATVHIERVLPENE